MHKNIVIYSVILGGNFLVLCDLISRILLKNKQIQVGAITSLIGSIAFVVIFYITYRKERVV